MKLFNKSLIGVGIFSAVYFMCASSCCDKEEEEEESNTTEENKAVDVYVAFNYDSITPTNKILHCAAIWKNGVITKLSPERDEMVRVEDLFVTEEGKVIAGGYFGDSVENAVVWEDYVETLLPEGRAVTGVSYGNGTVYACGYNREEGKSVAKWWIGNQPKTLKNGVWANSIYMGNNSCYIAGYGVENEGTLDQFEIARFWIDGSSYNALPRTGKTIDNTSEALDIINKDDMWWIVGREVYSAAGSLPKLWIKTTNNDMEPAANGSKMTSIAYEGNTFYIGGCSGNKAVYWTAQQASSQSLRPANVQTVKLTDGKNRNYAYVNDIAVKYGVVYTCGCERKDHENKPRLWKNTEDIFTYPTHYLDIEPKSVCVVPSKSNE